VSTADLPALVAQRQRAIDAANAMTWAALVECAAPFDDHVGTLRRYSTARLLDMGDALVVLELDALQLAADLGAPHQSILLADVLSAAAGHAVEVIIANADPMAGAA
jgi:hypothetical protein